MLLVEENEPSKLESGIVKSLHKAQVPLWIDGQNVIFEDGAVRKARGYIQFFTKPGTLPVTGMVSLLDIGLVPNLFFGDIEKLYRYNGSSVTTDGTGFSGSRSLSAFQGSAFQANAFITDATISRATQWSMESWGIWALASNGIDQIQINKCDGAGFINLTGTPPAYAQVIKKHKKYLLAFNTPLGTTQFEWCDTDNVEDWVNGDSGDLNIRDLGSEIIAAAELGEFVAAYGSNKMAIVQYIGAPYIYGAEVVLVGIGAVSKLSVISDGKMNWGISKQGVWETDGASYTYIDPPYIRKWLQDNINWNNGWKIAGVLNQDRDSVEWGVPTLSGNGDPDVTLVYNKKNKSWSFKSYGITSGIRKTEFDFPITGRTDGSVFYGEYGVDANGAGLDSWIQSKPMFGKSQLEWKAIEAIVTQVKDLVGTLNLYIGMQGDLNDTITWTSAMAISDDSMPLFITQNLCEGKYVSLKYRSTTLAADWGIAGFGVFGAITGTEFT